MSKLLKPFGHGGTSLNHGDLNFHIGWIEALVMDEEDREMAFRGPRAKRLERVQEALGLLNQAVEMGNEDP